MKLAMPDFRAQGYGFEFTIFVWPGERLEAGFPTGPQMEVNQTDSVD